MFCGCDHVWNNIVLRISLGKIDTCCYYAKRTLEKDTCHSVLNCILALFSFFWFEFTVWSIQKKSRVRQPFPFSSVPTTGYFSARDYIWNFLGGTFIHSYIQIKVFFDLIDLYRHCFKWLVWREQVNRELQTVGQDSINGWLIEFHLPFLQFHSNDSTIQLNVSLLT